MPQVFVLCEEIKTEDAERLIDMLHASCHEVKRFSWKQYPVADSLRHSLFSLLEKSVIGFVIISDSLFVNGWVLREIVTQNGLEERACLCPVFAEGVEPPAWLIEKNEHWLRISDCTSATLEAALHRAEQGSNAPH